jgi:hypothetical protein
MESLFITALSSAFVTMLTEFSKMTKIPPQVIVVVLSLILGIGYQALKVALPMPLQMQIQDFVAGTMAGSVFIYEFVIKRIQQSK